MPEYHFFSTDGPMALGVAKELSCVREAKFEAIDLLWEMLRDISGQFWEQQCVSLFVTDAAHETLFAVRLEIADAPEDGLHVLT